ncbi:MAG: helix-turn-helix domain-containing protein [Pseudomonadota bacterium]
MALIILLDTVLRGVGIGLLLVPTAILLLDPGTRRRALAGLALTLTVSCYLIVSAPAATALPPMLDRLLVLGAISVPPALTWLVLEIFLDAPADRRPWLALALLTLPLALLAASVPVFATLRGLLVLALYLGLIVLAVQTAGEDLVDRRRRARPAFVIIMALLGVVVTAVELTSSGAMLPIWIFLLQAGAIALLALLFGLWALDPDQTVWADGAVPTPAQAAGPRPEDAHLAERVLTTMGEGAWQREGLTIGQLAADLAVPEHRLRATINQHLGYRNFPAFVNGFRIEAAKAALTDPARTGTTILEIAYESGFSSLGPFNKAFRALTGQSPREFRRAADTASIPKDPR